MLAAAFALLIAAAPAVGYTTQLKRYPYLTDVVGSNATVNWATDQSATSGVVKWGPVGGSCTANTTTATRASITVGSVAQYQWKAQIPVSPDTQYCYRVYLGSSQLDLLGTDATPQFRSQLAAGSNAPFTFAVFGDWGQVRNADGTNTHQSNLMTRIAASGARFAVTTGDNAYESGSQLEYGDLVQTGVNTSAVFGPNFWKKAGSSIPLFPALGNHGHSNRNHLDIWPQDNAVASSGGRYTTDTYCCLNGTNSATYPSPWYAFDAGNARFYVLDAAWSNSNVGNATDYENDFDYHWAPGTPQRQWLEADLAANPRTHRFAFLHYPLYSDSPAGAEDSDLFLRGASSLEGLLTSHDVKLAFSGHAHFYQRNNASSLGLVNYVTGGGGADISSIGPCSSIDAYGIGWSDTSGTGNKCGAAPTPTSAAQVHHFLLVTVNGNQVTVTPTNENGQAFDPITYSAPAGSSNLSLTKADSPDPVAVGQNLTYTLTAANAGPDPATGVTVTDTLPAGVTFQSASPSQGSCSQSAGTVTCNLGTLSTSAQATVQIVVTPQSSGSITNTAQVAASQNDPTPANNTANQTTTVNPAADMALAKSDAPDPVAAGQNLTYTLTATNQGPSQATGVAVTDPLPAGVVYQSATPSQGTCSQNAGTVTCNLGTLAASAQASAQIVVRPQNVGQITNTATVSAAQADPISSNNSASQQTTVSPAADMRVTKTDSPDPVGGGANLTYNLTASNLGPSGATGVTVTDTLPPGVTFQSATPSQGSCNFTPGGSNTTLTPQADAYVIADNPGSNFGLASNLRTDATPDTRSYLRFNLSSVSGTVTNAKLRVFPNSANSTGYDVRGVSDNTWGETTLNYSNAPAVGGIAGSSGAVVASTWTEVDVTSLVSGSGLLSMAMTSTSGTNTSFMSREAANMPQLVLTVTPNNTVTCNLGTIANAGQATVQIVVQPQSQGQITNTAQVNANEFNPSSANNSASQVTTVNAATDLALVKTDSPDPATAGQNLTYTLTTTNNGPAQATGVTVTDNLPAGVVYQSASASQGSCSQSTGTVSCNLGTLASSAQATVQIVVRPQNGGQISNTASVSANESDPTTANNSSTQATTVTPVTDLSITKTDSPDPVLVGHDLTYTLTATNQGPSQATGVTATDNLPAGVSLISATPTQGSCSSSPSTVTCPLGTLASSGQAAVTIVVRPQSAGLLSNSASVSGSQTDPTPGNNSATQGTTVNPSADLSLTKADSPDPVAVGGNLTYTLTAANSGPSPATGVTVSDPLPAGVSFQSANTSQGSCSQASGTVTCNLGALASSAQATVTIVVQPQSTGLLTNTATVAATESDPSSANNSATQQTTVNPSANLSLTKGDAPDPVAVSANLTYTLTAANAGPSQATAVTVTDTLPASVSYQSATPSQGSCSQASGTVTCNLGTLASSAQATVQIVVRPQSAGTITNSASVSASQNDPNPSNNSASQATTVGTETDLSVTKTDSPDPVAVGANLTYTVTATNHGPSPATGVTVSDPLPAGVSFQSANASQGSCSQASGTVTCNLGALASSAQATVTIVVQAQSAGPLSNTASVSGNESDPSSANNSATQTTAVSAAANVSLTKTDSPDPVAAGANLTYTLTAANAGPSQATGVTVTDTLPAGVSYQSATPSQGSCSSAPGTVTCTLGTVAVSSQATVQIVVRPLVDGQFTNTASVSANEADPSSANNSATAQTTATPVTDLAVSQTDSPDPVAAGANLSYAVTATNQGPSTATGVTLTDTLPAGVSYQSATPSQGSCSQASGTVTCNVGALASSAQATVTIVVRPQADGDLMNSVTISGGEPDPSSANNTAVEHTTVDQSADLSVTKTDSPDPATATQDITYTLTAANAGPSQATGVTVTDTLPAGVSFQSANASQGSCSEASGTVTCELGVLASSAQATVTVVVHPQGEGQLTNTASVSAAQGDPVPANNSASQQTTVTGIADLALSQADSPDPVVAGQDLTYNLTATNQGPSAATSVTVTDNLPGGTSFQSASASQGTCQHSAGTVTCNLGTLAASQQATISLVIHAQNGGQITNTASASADQADPTPGNNSTSEQTMVTPVADLMITKADSPDPVFPEQPLTYTLTATNQGPSQATSVTVTDTLPAGVSYVSANPSQGSCSQSSGTVTCTVGTLAGSAQATVQIVVTPHDEGQITNTAHLSGNEPDPSSANDSASQSTTVRPISYVRPKGATPVLMSLVPASDECSTPNREHSPPLSQGACSPPNERSLFVTVGTPDANGAQARSTGSLRADVKVGNSNNSIDDADINLTASMMDVRRTLDLDDYLGELQVDLTLRITDRNNAVLPGGGNDPATGADTQFAFAMPCTATTAAAEGSTCTISTTADSVLPGTIVENKRAIWELRDIAVLDGGADGIAATPGNTVFAVPGIFAP